MTTPSQPPLVFVCATRMSTADFWQSTPLGQSLTALQDQGVAIQLELATHNTSPLASHYNKAIAYSTPEKILIFVHDDVRLDDLFISQRLNEGLAIFDAIGVAGNRRIKPRQGAWAFPDKIGQWDQGHNLLGGINHQVKDKDGFSRYGPTRAAARLLDGVFIAARAGTLQTHKVQFAPELPFHFYDLELCLRAHRAGMRLGVWPIAITHFSGGQYGSNSWKEGYKIFCQMNWPTAANPAKAKAAHPPTPQPPVSTP